MLYTEKLAEELSKSLEAIDVKGTEEDKDRTFDVVATTEDVDRDQEVIKVNGRDTSNWEKNPVILANHQYRIETIIGKGLKFYTSNGVKRCKGVFSKTNPIGVLARDLYNEGMLKTVSVGFLVKQRNATDYKIIEKAELLELSFVAVPCNPNAVSMDGKLFDEAVEKGLIVVKGDDEDFTPPVEEPTQSCSTGVECENCKKTSEHIATIQSDISELKLLIKSLTNDKVVDNEEALRLQQQKEVLQAINRATSTALAEFKKLK